LPAQEGVLFPPKKHSLVQVYNFNDLPLIAMNLIRIGAQVPGMASEVGMHPMVKKSIECNQGGAINALVGFGPMLWILVTPDAPTRGGFHSFDEIEINGIEVPETEGDMFLYFSSDYAELNSILASEIKEHFGADSHLIEERSFEGGDHSDIMSEKDKVLIDKSINLDTMDSSFALVQNFKTTDEYPCDLPCHNFTGSVDSGLGRYAITFSNQPKLLEEHSESVSQPPISRGLFFIPSLDLLTSLRMGGIRMGSLAINAKWKE